MKNKILILIAITLFLNCVYKTYAIDNPNLLSIENEFIKIIVNNDKDYEKGRFAVETTNGNPNNPLDDNQPLIYGRPKPWTSYTTIQIDNKNYIFGEKTLKRAGKNALYGKFISQTILNEKIITVYQYEKNIYVKQMLSFFRNPQTKVNDTAQITYEITNSDKKNHKIGLRIMLDTMLGINDGAPFRIGEKAIENESRFIGTDILDYWQTFDNLTSPNIIAQGTLKIIDDSIYPPDKLYLVNWGTLADNPWDFTFQEGRSFIRDGELEKDTALALYWEPTNIKPNDTKTITTLYGLGEISVAPGDLTIGLACPSELYATSKSDILVIGYVSNTGGFDSQNTKVKFNIPSEFKLTEGKKEYNLGLLKINESKQIALRLAIAKPIDGLKNLEMKITSSTLAENKIKRQIILLPPPTIFSDLIVPNEYIVSDNYFLKISIQLKNNDKFKITDIKANLTFSNNLELPFFEKQQKIIPLLDPESSKSINWFLKIKDFNKGDYLVSVDVSSNETALEKKSKNIKDIFPESKTSIKFNKERIKINEYSALSLNILNQKILQTPNLTINYNPTYLQYIRTSYQPLITKNKLEENFSIKEKNINIKSLTLTDKIDLADINIAKFYFKAIKNGNTEITLLKDNQVISTANILIE